MRGVCQNDSGDAKFISLRKLIESETLCLSHERLALLTSALPDWLTIKYDYTIMTIVDMEVTIMDYIPAGEFKSKCLKLMNVINRTHSELIITKHNKPIAKLVPIEDVKTKSIFGCMKDSVEIKGDIVGKLHVEWTADEKNI